jgi:molecular chaperone GrpE (heat shock protein)
MSKQKIEWEKEKALLLQKISQLETQIDDYDGREQRLKASQHNLVTTLATMQCDDNGKATMAMIVGSLKRSKTSPMRSDR